MPVVTNAELASAVQQVVSRVDAREDQLTAWQAGTPEGGPFADGTYAITNLLGETSYFKSPARLQYEVGLLTTAGTGAVATAEAARDAAEAALASAVVQATNASSSASTASTKASEAQVFRNEAANSEANALAHRNAASASASAAALSEADAEAAAIAAAASAASADADATAAAASAAAAATFDPVNFYTKTQADTLLAAKLATADFSWNNMAGKPTTFTPSAHTHAIADVTGLQTALDGKQAAGSYAAAVHGHAIADVTGLQTALDGKQAAGSYAAASHTHVIADVTGLQAALDGKQPAGSYLTGITGTMVTTALGYTPYNSSNPAGYISGITSGMVTTALGYTPANKAGDNFTGAVGFLGGSAVAANGDFYARRSGGTTGVYYFVDGVDKYLYWDGVQYIYGGTYTVAASRFYGVNDIRAPIFYDSDNTAYFVDPTSTSVLNTARASRVQFSSGNAAITLNDSSYQILADPTGRPALYLGGADPGSYYDNSTHYFRDRGAVQYATIAASGVYGARFYDFNDTGYYVDPNGTSNLYFLSLAADEGLNVKGIRGQFSAGSDGQGISLFSNVDIGYPSGWGAGLGNTPSRGLSVYGGGRFSYGGSGFLSADTSVRAPIFYDSNNTGWYLDPASTSSLNNLNVNGSTVYPAQWTTRFQSSSDFPNGTLVTTDIPATASAGDSFIIEITGKSYDGSNPPFKVVAQGYLYSDTIINYSGISYGGSFSSYIKVFQDGGVLKFWWPRIGYWNSFNVNVMSMDGQTNNTITRNRVAAITDSTEPTGTKKVQINLNRALREDAWIGGKYFNSSGSISASIYYDTDNTAYYVDAAGTSVLQSVAANGSMSANDWFRSNGQTGWYSQTYGGGIYMTDGTWVRVYNGRSFLSDATIQAGGDVRAPVFYDSDNTGYYVDPSNSGASIVVNGYMLGGFGALSTSGTLDWNDTSNVRSGSTGTLLLGTAANGPGPSIYFHPFNFEYSSKDGSGNVTQMAIAYGSPGNKLYMRGRYSGTWGSWVQFLDTGSDAQYKSGYLESGSSLRAPIFYDSNDTGYYCDPNWYSQFNYVWANNWFRSNGDTGWYNQTYAGGIYMIDTTWVRVYNGKAFFVSNEIAATGNITAYYSDERLKTKTGTIDNALDKVSSLEGFLYVENDLARSLGYSNKKQQVGVSAQAVKAVLPEAVSLAPVDFKTLEDGAIVSKSGEEYLTVDYSRIVPLLIEAIKELRAEVEALKNA